MGERLRINVAVVLIMMESADVKMGARFVVTGP